VTAWKRAAKLWRQAAQVWRQTVIEREGMVVELQKQVFERDQINLALSMKLGEALEEVSRLQRAVDEGVELIEEGSRLLAQSQRLMFLGKDDGGRREISNDGQY
jgi:hypothetical protein